MPSSKFALSLVFALSLLAAPAADARAGTPPDPLVKAHLTAQKVKFDVDADGDYKVTFDLGNGRSQIVWIRSQVTVYGTNKVREIWSPGLKIGEGDLPAKTANRLLRHSHDVKMGGWTKQKAYAMFVVKIPANASAQQMRDAAEAAADAADEIEKELTPGSDDL